MTCWAPHDHQAAGAGWLRLSGYRAGPAHLLLGLFQVIGPQVRADLHRHV